MAFTLIGRAVLMLLGGLELGRDFNADCQPNCSMVHVLHRGCGWLCVTGHVAARFFSFLKVRVAIFFVALTSFVGELGSSFFVTALVFLLLGDFLPLGGIFSCGMELSTHLRFSAAPGPEDSSWVPQKAMSLCCESGLDGRILKIWWTTKYIGRTCCLERGTLDQ